MCIIYSILPDGGLPLGYFPRVTVMNDFTKALLLDALKAALTAFASVIVNAMMARYMPPHFYNMNGDEY